MPKYSSRVSNTGGANVKKPGRPPAKKKSDLPSGKDIAVGKGLLSGGSLIKALDKAKMTAKETAAHKKEIQNVDKSKSSKGGSVLIGQKSNPRRVKLQVEPNLALSGKGSIDISTAVAGGLETGGSGLQSGGAIADDIKAAIPKVTKVAKRSLRTAKSAARNLDPTNLTGTLQGVVGKLTHNGMIQVLQHMTPEQFHHFQGVSGAHLPGFNSHPLSGIARQVLGGSFTHPRHISKMATRDILRATSAQQLATALHMEMMDKQNGMDVGGGLLDSSKHVFNRGLSGLKSGVSAGTRIGKVLHGALSTGIQVGQVFSPVVNALFPEAGALIDTGISSAEALKAGLEVGVKSGEKIAEGLEGISPLGTDDAPEAKAPPPLRGLVESVPELSPGEVEEDIPAPPSFNPPAPSFEGLNDQEITSLGFNPSTGEPFELG